MKLTAIVIFTSLIFLSGCSFTGTSDTYGKEDSKSQYFPLSNAQAAGTNEVKFRVQSSAKNMPSTWAVESLYSTTINGNFFTKKLSFNIDGKEFVFYRERKMTTAYVGGVQEIAHFKVSEDLIAALSNAKVVEAKLTGWKVDSADDDFTSAESENNTLNDYNHTLSENNIVDLKVFIREAKKSAE